MQTLTDHYSGLFDRCLEIVDYGSEEKRRDTAFAMTWLLLKEKGISRTLSQQVLEVLAIRTFKKTAMLDNLRQPPSENTCLGYNYSPFHHLLCALAEAKALNLATVQFIFEHLNAEYKKYSGGSCMQDAVYNVPFYGFNCATLKACLNAGYDPQR